MLNLFYYLLEGKKEAPFIFVCTYKEGDEELPIINAVTAYPAELQEYTDSMKGTLIEQLVNRGALFTPVDLTVEEANQFISEIPLYKNVTVRLPKWKTPSKFTIRPRKSTTSIGVTSFNVDIFIDSEKVTMEQLENIIKHNAPLAMIKNKWVKFDKKQVKNSLNVIKSLQDAMDEDILPMKQKLDKTTNAAKSDGIDVQISNDFWLPILTEKLSKIKIPTLDLSQLKCELYDFQKTGVEWLLSMHNIKLGALLADDCGLGKTVMVLSLLLQTNNEKTLIVAPPSLLGNWGNEIDKFAPKLRYYIAHSSFNKDIIPDLRKYDIIITTYDYVKNKAWLRKKQFDNIVLDEAQTIKNSETQRAIALSHVKANWRLCVTATPLENYLEELYNILNYICPGLFGGCEDFIKTDPAIIRDIVTSFMLRRPSTVVKMPNKEIIDVPISMSEKQIALYYNVIDNIKRNRLSVLSSIIKLRQILDHPSLYTGSKQFDMADSRKMEQLSKIALQCKLKGEKMIVFAQFIGLLEPLYNILHKVYRKSGAIIDGSLSSTKRTQIAQQFEKGKYDFLVCSLKATNAGLNLVSANVCVFFDLCWNPSVEKQAMDRIYRLTQKKDVRIYRFITSHTIEEGMNNLLISKRDLFNSVITEKNDRLINKQFIELFKKELCV